MSNKLSSTQEGKQDAEEVEMSKVENQTPAAIAHKTETPSVEDNQTAHADTGKPKDESSNAEEAEKESPKEKDTDEEADNADGYDPFSQQSLAPLMSSNQYSMRKTASQALMDVALMMANISQLRTLLTAGDDIDYSVALIVMVALSLTFQLLFAILIFIIWSRESDQRQKDDYIKALREFTEATSGTTDTAAKNKARNSYLRRQMSYQGHRITSHLNYVTMVLVFIITVINMFITGFGIKLESPPAESVPKGSSN